MLDPLSSFLVDPDDETARIDLDHVYPRKTAKKTLKGALSDSYRLTCSHSLANLRDETEGDTGNEGVEITRWYRVTCFVVTSMDQFLRANASLHPSATTAQILSRYARFAYNTDVRSRCSHLDSITSKRMSKSTASDAPLRQL